MKEYTVVCSFLEGLGYTVMTGDLWKNYMTNAILYQWLPKETAILYNKLLS